VDDKEVFLTGAFSTVSGFAPIAFCGLTELVATFVAEDSYHTGTLVITDAFVGAGEAVLFASAAVFCSLGVAAGTVAVFSAGSLPFDRNFFDRLGTCHVLLCVFRDCGGRRRRWRR